MAKITWSGHSCFQLNISSSKDNSAQIVIDPFNENGGLKVPKLEADVLVITHDHPDHNSTKNIKGEYFLINGPGEYDIKGISIRGISAFHDNVQGKEKGRVTIFTFEGEDMRFCHLSDFGQSELTNEQLEEIGEVDILMIPVGGGGFTLDGNGASKIISQIEPKIVLPMHYHLPGLKMKLDGVDKFLKAMGKNSVTPQDKLQVKQSTLPKEGMEIVLLTQ
ncbi:MAG: MBL fold metallo-hydrolase [Candidatus Staskawiczbacteria bacterium]|jgi:L-ascorbate metabolism protein UlaG (beta-lactamase superfamily)